MDDTQDPTDRSDVPTSCSICLSEPPINAVKLDCGHIFCFLCIKSASETTGVCALCRAQIPIEFDFKEHRILGIARVPSSESGYFWFYEGFRGWWLYDADTNSKLEQAHSRRLTRLDLYIAGSMYVIDLSNMSQVRQDGQGRVRRIRRDTLSLQNVIGMAGIKGEDFDDILAMMRSAQSHPASNVNF